MSSWSSATLASYGRARRDIERRLPVLSTLTVRLINVNVMDAGTRLAAQLFLTALPLLFVVAALAPGGVRENLLHSVRAIFGLTGAAAHQLESIYAPHSAAVREGTGVIGVVVVLLSATATSRALARVCERAWALPRTTKRIAVWRWFAWLFTSMALLILQGPLRDGFGTGPWLGVPLSFLSSIGLWWWTQHLLLAKRVPWLPLLPPAVLTAAATSALSITAHLYIPGALNRSVAEYGPLGSVFTLMSWLVVTCVVITCTLTVGAVLAKEPFLDRYLRPRRTPQA